MISDRYSPEIDETKVIALAHRALAGELIIDFFNDMVVSDISNDIRLSNVFYYSDANTLSDFLQMGARRLEIRNYGMKSEKKLLLAVIEALRDYDQQAQMKDVSPRIEHDSIIGSLKAKAKNISSISDRAWQNVSDELKGTNYCETPVASVAAKLSMKWPLSHKSHFSRMLIGDFLGVSLSKIKSTKGWGRKRIAIYVACVFYLHKMHTSQEEEVPKSLEQAINEAWGSGFLKKTEKELLMARYGIRDRKHTLQELADRSNVTRERIRQIIKMVYKKLALIVDPGFLKKELSDRKLELFEIVSGGAQSIRRSSDLDQLEEHLPFEVHLSIEICYFKSHRNHRDAALGDWLDDNFDHDESNWYKDAQANMSPDGLPELVNASLISFIDEL